MASNIYVAEIFQAGWAGRRKPLCRVEFGNPASSTVSSQAWVGTAAQEHEHSN
ncbi:hypothetical protein MasN3_27180 [Massilia varians]|uniref:Uncharacterized protein n=1 Tax=Massilia varians TaxID=457921 RepID=A0ABN6TGX9_9BURK|nr:hypothetical protein MasN3_27180 [Massilia varians]